MIHRLRALFGSIAYSVDRFVRAPFGVAPIPVSGVLLAVILLGAGSALTAAATIEAIENQPEPEPTTVEAIVAPAGAPVVGWVRVDGILAASLEIRRDTDDDGVESPEESVFYFVLTDAPAARYALLVRAHAPPAAFAPTGVGARVELTGILTSDPPLEEIAQSPELASVLEGTEHSRTRLLVEGSQPAVLGSATFAPSVAMGVVALVLLGSRVAGYPVFRRRRSGRGAPPARSSARRLSTGAAVPLEIHGTVRTPYGRTRVDGAPGRLIRYPVEEFTRRRWQYWGAALDALRGRNDDAGPRAVGGSDPVLALDSGYASVLLPIGLDAAPALSLEPGDLYTARGRRAAVRLRGADVDAALVFATEDDRDLALGEIEPELRRAAAAARSERRRSADGDGTRRQGMVDRPSAERPWTVTLAAALLALLGAATIFGTLTTQSPSGDPQHPVAVALRIGVGVAAAIGLFASAAGLLTGVEWGRLLAVNIGIVGVIVAAVSFIASQVCLQPVGPTYSCRPELENADRILSLLALAALGFSLWAVARSAAQSEEAGDPAGGDRLRSA